MKIEHITEAIGQSIGTKVFDEWHHEGRVETVQEDWMRLIIDGEEFLVMVTRNDESASCAEPDVNPEKKPSRKIDHDKVLALHNSGWSNKAIAEELGINPTTVSLSLKRSREKLEKEEKGEGE